MFINSDFEQMVLGGLLIDPKILDDYHFHTELFGVQRNKKIFEEIVKCIEDGIKPDIIVISDRLKDESGAYISGLTSKVLSTANFQFYIDALEELNKKRKLETMFKVGLSEIAGKSAQEMIEYVEDTLTNLNEEKKRGYIQLREHIGKAIDRLEKKYNHAYNGIRIGYRDPDYYIEELPGGTLNIIAARTSMGKTAVALNIAYNMTKQKRKVGIFSCEMSGDLLAERFIQKIAHLNTRKMHKANKDDFDRVTEACQQIYDLPIWVDDTPNIYLYELKSKARRMQREGIEIIFVDYIGLIRTTNEKMSLYEKYGMIAAELKQLARELNIPIIALSQLARVAEKERPTLADLRNSGQIEDHSDSVVLLSGHRKDENMELTFDIAKNRLGAVGECKLMFNKNHQSISDIDYSGE